MLIRRLNGFVKILPRNTMFICLDLLRYWIPIRALVLNADEDSPGYASLAPSLRFAERGFERFLFFKLLNINQHHSNPSMRRSRREGDIRQRRTGGWVFVTMQFTPSPPHSTPALSTISKKRRKQKKPPIRRPLLSIFLRWMLRKANRRHRLMHWYQLLVLHILVLRLRLHRLIQLFSKAVMSWNSFFCRFYRSMDGL